MGSANALACELEECHFIFHTQMGKLHVYLQLNLMIPNRAGRYEAIYGGTINLFPVWKKKCYYQGVVIGQPGSYVSVSTCQGIRGSIILENATYLITPLKYANLTHYAHAFMRVSRGYGTLSEKAKSVCLRKPYLNPLEAPHAGIGKRLRLSLLVGNDLCQAEWLKLKPKDLFHFLFEIVNTLDLLLKQIDLRVSIVHAGLWITKSLIDEEQDAILSLADIAQLSMKRKDSFSADVTMLLSAAKFKSTQLAVFTNSICTSNATGLIKIPNKFHPFYTSLLMARSIGHILGVGHDGYSVKQDNKDVSTIMESSHKVELLIRRAYNQIFLYTDCARQDFTALLNTGYGYCLLDLPLEVENNNTAKCGDKVVDENEECDCGTAEECHSIDPCCEPLKCRLKMGAQCSEGPCCDECMFSPKKKICRPSQYDHCDFPEYCNGTSALCPANSYNQDGTPCGPHGKEYCYNGKCQSASGQCREIWGPESSMAHESCFRRSMRGDAFGHCGFDGRGNPKACSPRDYLCGVLFCQGGSASSRELSEYDASNNEDIIECRISLDRSFPWNATLIRDGTKCGANMMCKDQRCIRLPNVEREKKCPTNNVSLTCSGHGTCTNLNTCFCDPGWAETDCSFEVAEREISAEYLVTEQDGNDKQIYSKVFIDKRCAERSGGTLLVAAGCIAVASVVIVLLHFIQIRRHKIFYSPRSLEIWKVQRELLENNLADPIPAGKCCNPKLLRSHDGKSALETEARRIVEGGNCSDGFSVNLSANSTNGCSFDISRGMAKWIRPRLSQIDPSSSSSRSCWWVRTTMGFLSIT
uniref:EGF-like domain-containing protein n=1 Tax=Trichuris muris TaxID=70415 RepID=A0A5S6QLH4_TRIMR